MAPAPASSSRLRRGRVPGQRRGRGDDRRAEVEPEVAGAQVHGHASSPFSPAPERDHQVGVRVDRVDVGHAAVHARQLLVVAPPLVGVGLGELGELARPARGPCAARMANRVSVATKSRIGIDGLRGVQLERLAVLHLAGLEAVERPVAALDGVLLVATSTCYMSMPWAMQVRVGDDQGRPRPGIGLEERLDRLGVVGAHRDLGHEDVAVGPGDGAEVLLAGRLAGGRELGDRAARGGLGRLAAGVGVDLGVEDEDVDVACRSRGPGPGRRSRCRRPSRRRR